MDLNDVLVIIINVWSIESVDDDNVNFIKVIKCCTAPNNIFKISCSIAIKNGQKMRETDGGKNDG